MNKHSFNFRKQLVVLEHPLLERAGWQAATQVPQPLQSTGLTSALLSTVKVMAE